MKLFWSNLLADLHAAVRGFIRHKGTRLGAALAYYTLLSLSPLLMIVLAVLWPLFGAEAARGAVSGQIEDLVGENGARAVEALVANADQPRTGIVATLIGLAVLLFGASGIFVELREAINDIWEVPATPRPPLGLVRSLAIDRLLALAMIASLAFLLLVSLMANAILIAIGEQLVAMSQLQTVWIRMVTELTSLFLTMGLFALIFRLLPARRTPWRHVLRGAAFTALLFMLGKTLIGLYIGRAAVGSAYGAAGSLVVVLVWVYYSTQILLFGAEMVHAIDQRSRGVHNYGR